MGVKKLIGTAILGIKRRSPEILFVGGVISGGVALYLTAKQTPKAIAAREQYVEEKRYIETALDIGETAINEKYTQEDYDRDIKIENAKYVKAVAKAYIPPAIAAATSLACFLCSFGILKNRLAGAVTLLATTTEAFNAYRQRVKDDLGEEKDYQYLTGATQETTKTTEIDENGKKHTVTKKQWCLDPGLEDIPFIGPYSILISPKHKIWKNNGGNPDLMAAQLKIIQSNMTTSLHMNGSLTLDKLLFNDGGLGFDPRDTKFNFDQNIISNIGWLDTKTEGMDRCIDFGCWDKDGNLEYIPGKGIIIDLNCDGWIMGKLPERPKSGQELVDACREHPEIEK
jgi:hypothetical protein